MNRFYRVAERGKVTGLRVGEEVSVPLLQLDFGGMTDEVIGQVKISRFSEQDYFVEEITLKSGLSTTPSMYDAVYKQLRGVVAGRVYHRLPSVKGSEIPKTADLEAGEDVQYRLSDEGLENVLKLGLGQRLAVPVYEVGTGERVGSAWVARVGASLAVETLVAGKVDDPATVAQIQAQIENAFKPTLIDIDIDEILRRYKVIDPTKVKLQYITAQSDRDEPLTTEEAWDRAKRVLDIEADTVSKAVKEITQSLDHAFVQFVIRHAQVPRYVFVTEPDDSGRCEVVASDETPAAMGLKAMETRYFPPEDPAVKALYKVIEEYQPWPPADHDDFAATLTAAAQRANDEFYFGVDPAMEGADMSGGKKAPRHYAPEPGRYEAIDEIRVWFRDEASRLFPELTDEYGPADIGDMLFLGFCLGNWLKYGYRVGKKGDPAEDEAKGAWYLAMAKYTTGSGPDPRANRDGWKPQIDWEADADRRLSEEWADDEEISEPVEMPNETIMTYSRNADGSVTVEHHGVVGEE